MKLLSTMLLVAAVALAQTPQRYRIDAFAGTPAIGDGGPATSALLDQVQAVLADNKGGFYLAGLFRIRYVGADGNIRTVAGTGYAADLRDGVKATETGVISPTDLKLAPNGDLYFADATLCQVARIDGDGIVRVVAGTGDCGFSGDRGSAKLAQLNVPYALAFDPSGRLLIADQYNGRIRRVDAGGNIDTIAGTGSLTTFAAAGLPALQTAISYPTSLASAADGTLYFAEYGYRRVRKIAPDGLVTTVAGSGQSGNSGDAGQAALAQFRAVDRIALDAPRNRLFISDPTANRIRVVDLNSGTISNAVGITIPNSSATVIDAFSGDGKPGSDAGIAGPRGISVDQSGGLYLADSRNYRVRYSDTRGIRTVAGRFRNTADGPAAKAEFYDAAGLAVDPDGNVLLSDAASRTIRRVTRANISIAAGLPTDRWPANDGYYSLGDNGPALSARFAAPTFLAVDSTGRIYVNDEGKLRRIDNGVVSALGAAPVGAARMTVDGTRKLLYVAVPDSHKVVVADLAAPALSFRDFAGTGTAGFAGDGATALAARLNRPTDVAVDAAGNVYIADSSNFRLRKVAAGVISTIAGTGIARSSLNMTADAQALSAPISPIALTVDAANRVTIVEGYGGVVRQLDPTTNRLTIIAGAIGQYGLSGDGGLATGARFVYLAGVKNDAAGNLYLSDGINGHVRVLKPVTLSRFELVSGNAQAGTVTTKLAAPLVVRVGTADGLLPGVSIRFTATGATVNPATAVTAEDGTARTEVTLGATAGPVTITAALDGLPSVTFQATATAAVTVNPLRPAVRANGGAGTAGAFGGGSTISPGTWMEIYGTNLSSTTRSWGDADFQGAQAPTELDGVKVTVGGRSAFVNFVSPGQINVQVPDGVSGPVPVVVTNANGASDPVTVVAAAAAPGLLAPPVFTVGGVAYVVAIHQDGAFVGKPDLIPGANFRLAKPGDVITLYGVGFGPTAPVSPAGQVVAGAATLPNVKITIGGQDAQVLYGGLAPGALGLYQFNLVLPSGSGDLSLVVTAGSFSSQRLTISAE